jgi:uncharacterized protein
VLIKSARAVIQSSGRQTDAKLYRTVKGLSSNKKTKNMANENRGFAGMDKDKQRKIASEGGKAAHRSGHAHEFTSEEAAKAGAKGGSHSHGGGSQENM